jgi:hypothetical protein
MSASIHLKSLFAGFAAVAIVGTAIAQGTPPNANVTNPAVGAGQQSSQQTPMGTTGTPGGTGATGTGAATMGATGSSGSTTGSSASMSGSNSTMGASSNSGATGSTRAVRADRN